MQAHRPTHGYPNCLFVIAFTDIKLCGIQVPTLAVLSWVSESESWSLSLSPIVFESGSSCLSWSLTVLCPNWIRVWVWDLGLQSGLESYNMQQWTLTLAWLGLIRRLLDCNVKQKQEKISKSVYYPDLTNVRT